jgi:hypothetical protein
MKPLAILIVAFASMLSKVASIALGQVPSFMEPKAVDFAELNLSVSEVRVVDSIKIQGYDFKADNGRKLIVLVLKSRNKLSGTVKVSKETFSAVYGKPETIDSALVVAMSDLDAVHWSAKVGTTYNQPTTVTIALAYSLPPDIKEFSVRYQAGGEPRELAVHLPM